MPGSTGAVNRRDGRNGVVHYPARMATRITHVFFDVADTLLRVRGSVGHIYAQVARRHGLDVPEEPLTEAFIKTVKRLPQNVAPQRTDQEILQSERRWWYEIAQGSFAELGTFEHFDAFFDDLFETFRDASAWELLPNVQCSLEQLTHMGIPCSIISDIDSRVFALLKSFEIDGFFSGVYLSFRTGYGKPDARLFNSACEASEVSPQDAVHIGDSWKKDILGARNAGMNAIWYRPQGSDEAHAPWIADLAQAPGVLQMRWPR